MSTNRQRPLLPYTEAEARKWLRQARKRRGLGEYVRIPTFRDYSGSGPVCEEEGCAIRVRRAGELCAGHRAARDEEINRIKSALRRAGRKRAA